MRLINKGKDKYFFWQIIIPTLFGFFLFTFVIFVVMIPAFKKSLLDTKRDMLKELTNSALSILEEYHKKEVSNELSESAAKTKAIETIKNLRYGNEGKDYFWINDMHPNMIMHPYRKDLINSDLSNYKDAYGKKLFKEFVNIVSQFGDGYLEYSWQWKDNSIHIVPKLSYVKGFKPWGWIVGTGVYIEDVNNEIGVITTRLVIISSLILLFLGFVLFYIDRQSFKIERERIKASYHQKESETKYIDLYNNAPDMFVSVEVKNKVIIECNQTLSNKLHISKNKIIGKNIWEIYHPDCKENVMKTFELLATTGEIQDTELQLITGDNRTIDVSLNISAVKDSNGIITIGRLTLRDITRRKLTENALLISERKFRQLFMELPDAIFLSRVGSDVSGDIFDANPAAEAQTGYTHDELLEMNIMKDLVSDEIPYNLVFEREETLKKGNTLLLIEKKRRKNGEEYWVQVLITIIEYENSMAALSVNHDITRQKMAEEALKESEIRFRNIFANTTVGLYQTTIDGKILMANPALINMFGFKDKDKYFEQNVKSFYADPPKREEFINQLQKNGVVYGFETTMKKKDGSQIVVVQNARIIKDSKGRALYLEGAVEDITERKHFENAMIEARLKAEESDRLKSEFLAQMSHEIRTPINVILSFTDLLKEYFVNNPSYEVGEIFLSITNAGQRIIRTIDLILNTAEIQKGLYKPAFKKIDLYGDILVNIEKEFNNSAKSKNLELTFNNKCNDTIIYADDYSVSQIFINLVDNALKYTKKGRIEVNLLKNSESQLVIQVTDTGIGISDKYISMLFTPFSQEEQGYTRKFEGTGLGLALVKKYCEINKADISVTSTKGEGTTFTVTFPQHL